MGEYCGRDVLPKGYELKTNRYTYVLENLPANEKGENAKEENSHILALGGSCVVYYASYKDNLGNPHYVLVKEFNPNPNPDKLEVKRRRNDTKNGKKNGLFPYYGDKDTYIQSLQMFKDGYNKHVAMKNIESLKNVTSPPIDYIEANDTGYIVLDADNGNTLEQKENLFTILEVILSLSKAICEYHKNGYLHLDVKEQNIFLFGETNQIVRLFDFDSIIKLDELSENTILCYSKEEATPEQHGIKDKTNTFKDICIQTDMFLIAHLLFRFIFNRRYTSDDLHCDNFEFDKKNKIFDAVDPNVFSTLNQFFLNTIRKEPTKRYNSDEEFISALEEIIELARPRKYSFIVRTHSNESFFAGREDELDDIANLLDNHNCVVLHGIGGEGKTTLVNKYAQIHKNKYHTILITNGSDGIKNLIVSDKEIGINGLDPRDNKDIDVIYKDKMNILMQLCNEGVLLIIDGMNQSDDNLKDLLKLNCKILITSRYDFSKVSFVKQKNIYNIDKDAAMKVFEHYSEYTLLDSEKEKIEILTKKIRYHALLVSLIAKSMYASAVSLDEIVKTVDGAIYSFVEEEVTLDDDNFTATVDKILEKIFNISALSEAENDVLMNMSLIRYEGIYIRKFKECCELNNLNDVNSLIKKGWILESTITEDDKNVRVIMLHQVISDVVFKTLSPNTVKCEKMLQAFIDEASDLEHGTIDKFLDLASILDFISNRIEMSSQMAFDIIFFAGDMYKGCYQYEKALEFFFKALDICKRVLGKNNPDTASSYNSIGLVYSEKGEYKEALEFCFKALDIRERVLGKDNPDTATSYNNIGGVYYSKGEYKEALEFYFKALDIRERVLGKDHPNTASSYNNIGGVYDSKGEYKEALEFYFKALDIKEQVLGKDNPSTATSYNNIGGVYYSKGEYKEALEFYSKALDIYERVLGKNNPYTATSYNNIGLVYSKKGEYKEALEFYFKALDIYERVLGKDHPSTASSYNNIGFVYNNEGEYKEALEFYFKALDIYERVLGKDHPSTATSYNNIGLVYSKKGEYKEALEFYFKASDIRELVLGKDHPDTATSYNNIGGVYHSKGEYKEALEFYFKALDIYERVLGKDNPDTATCYNNIGCVYDSKGEYKNAIKYCQHSLDIFYKHYGITHNICQGNIMVLSECYKAIGNRKTSLKYKKMLK